MVLKHAVLSLLVALGVVLGYHVLFGARSEAGAGPAAAAGAGGPDDVPAVIREARERAARERREQDIRTFREQIRRLDAEGRVADNDLEAAAAILSDHAQAVRDLHEGRESAPPEEREDLRRRFDALQAETERALLPWLSGALVRQLSGRVNADDAGRR